MRNFLLRITDFFSRLFEKDLFLKITSFVAAVIIWFVVSVSVYPTIDRVIYNVPIKVDLTGTYAEANNFQVVNQSDAFTTVYITGNRGQVGNLKSEDLVAIATAENVSSAKSYNLPIEIECLTGKQFEITKLSNTFVSVEFDEIITKEIAVKPLMRQSDVTVASGFICDTDDVIVVPATVSVTGPKETVENVTDAYVRIVTESELSQTYEYSSSELLLYSGDTEINDEDNELSFNRTSFNIRIPVLQKQIIQLGVKITNAPASFNTNAYMEKLILSSYELEVAAPSELIKDITLLDVGSIDMREVDIGSVFTFNSADFLPEGYQNLSEINTITVSCPSEGLEKVLISIRGSAVQFINAPAQFDFKMVTSGFTPYFIGPANIIDNISYIDIVSQIDLINNFDMVAGDFKLPVLFSIPAYDSVWCIGSDGALSPKATVTVTLKE